ncbi:MAG: pyrimidine dimer DNA glycosylase/endonuclease V [Alcaligenaceae bacterium]|nr:pyrimidine dimer DNA glycosylase/endonuclease V [Alcaligenaceae bacterium]
MRIWSIHPSYLDAKGLVALWRETLLAKNVLLGNTKGYKHHPQLKRFQSQTNPVAYIEAYLDGIYQESLIRGYQFNSEKIYTYPDQPRTPLQPIKVTTGQLAYEQMHLLRKLATRDEARYQQLKQLKSLWNVHPLFTMIEGEIEDWEVVI